MNAPPDLDQFEAEVRASGDDMIKVPRVGLLALIRYVRALEDEREDVGVGMTDKYQRG